MKATLQRIEGVPITWADKCGTLLIQRRCWPDLHCHVNGQQSGKFAEFLVNVEVIQDTRPAASCQLTHN